MTVALLQGACAAMRKRVHVQQYNKFSRGRGREWCMTNELSNYSFEYRLRKKGGPRSARSASNRFLSGLG